MNSKLNWKPMMAGAAAALLLTLGTAAVYPQVTPAETATPVAPEQLRRGAPDVDHYELLAEALGITTDELQAAQEKALDAALTQAVEKDLLTQTQADALRERMTRAGAQDFGRFGLAVGRNERFLGGDIDFEALLADALGITVDQLQAAEEQVQTAAIDQAVADGTITQEQADLAEAWRAFRSYWAEQQPTFEEQLDAAVKAGAITQEQADLLQEQGAGKGAWGRGDDDGFGFGPGMMEPGMGRGGRHGGMRGGMRGGMQGGMQDGQGFGPGMMEPRGRGGFPGETPSDEQAPQSSSGLPVPASSF
jgi:hypothetical protein